MQHLCVRGYQRPCCLHFPFLLIDICLYKHKFKMTTCRWSQLAEEGSESEDKLDEEEEDKENLVRNV